MKPVHTELVQALEVGVLKTESDRGTGFEVDEVVIEREVGSIVGSWKRGAEAVGLFQSNQIGMVQVQQHSLHDHHYYSLLLLLLKYKPES